MRYGGKSWEEAGGPRKQVLSTYIDRSLRLSAMLVYSRQEVMSQPGPQGYVSGGGG